MCCPQCELFNTCNSAVTMRHRVFPMAGLPPDHYVFCRTTEPCNEQCKACSFLVQAVAHPPGTMMRYHCCRRCKNYATCTDFKARHLKALDRYKAVMTIGEIARNSRMAAELAVRRSTQSLRRGSIGANP